MAASLGGPARGAASRSGSFATWPSSVYDAGTESKFERLREVLVDPKFGQEEKLIIFTEHRDTLEFLVRRLGRAWATRGRSRKSTGACTTPNARHEVERFRKPADEGGARFLVCTDAAGEGINLQFCWIMINYDIPWNPARLEQRMGRIHRYGQKHDPVVILNLVASNTREGRVLETLLRKLDDIRKELGSDKVFDVIGRLFEGVSIKQYMEMAVAEERTDEATRELEGRLTREQVEALLERERVLYGTGGEVAKALPRLRQDLDREMYQRLLPGYVRQYVESAAPLVGVEIAGDPGRLFLPAVHEGLVGVDPLLQVLGDVLRRKQRACLSFVRPTDHDVRRFGFIPANRCSRPSARWSTERLGDQARRGAVFVDPDIGEALPVPSRARCPWCGRRTRSLPTWPRKRFSISRLVGVKQFEGAQIIVCPVEHLLLLKGGRGLPAGAQRLAVRAHEMREEARAFLVERVAREMAVQRRQALVSTLAEREGFVARGFDYQEAELAAARAKQAEKARAGSAAAQKELARVKEQQRQLAQRRHQALAVLRREPELIRPRAVEFIATALVVPSSDPVDREQYEAKTDEVAMALAWAFEESEGAIVKDVHTPELARAAGLPDNPGFDLWSIRPNEKRCIEVKGRAGTGEIEISANEWAKACNLREQYWLYVVYDCATPKPRLVRIQDPFGALLAKAKGSVVISAKQILEASRKGV
ncbi:MAG: hypothetical protein KatS3mg105_0583 [Gemmatales bacterium]|nr:MAG: hypothetical protein KatS3mg105_0583 [Gemmatales bacterium]